MTTTPDISKVLGDQSQFESEDVLSVALEIPSIAGGLRDAVRVDPFLMHGGDEAYLLMKVKCDKIRHDPFVDRNAGEKKDERRGAGGPWERVQILIPGTVAFVDEEFAAEHIDDMAERIALLREEEEGIMRLDLEQQESDLAAAEAEEAGQ